MLGLLDHPAIQSGVAPIAVALIVAASLASTRFSWLAIIPAYAAMVALDTGFSLFPPTVARKTILVGLVAPLVGIAADLYPRASRTIAAALAVLTGLLSIWVFTTVLQNREQAQAVAAGAGVVAFVAVMVAAVLRLRDDGPRAGATGVGLGLAVGIAGLFSASIGALMAGVAIAAACGGMLIVQAGFSRALAPGFTGTLPVGLLCALVAAGTLLLAELPWYALPLLLLIPAATSLPAPTHRLIARIAVLVGYALVAAIIPIGAAWYAARGSFF